MEYQFSERVKSLKPSAIREILKNSSDPSVIPPVSYTHLTLPTNREV